MRGITLRAQEQKQKQKGTSLAARRLLFLVLFLTADWQTAAGKKDEAMTLSTQHQSVPD